MKNTERLPKYILKNLRENFDDARINGMTPDSIFKEFLEYEGILGYTSKIKHAYQDIFKNYDEWCCWVLDREEIEVLFDRTIDTVADDVTGIFVKGELKEEFIQAVVKRFKNTLHTSFDDWEDQLSYCINEEFKSVNKKKEN